MEGKFYVGNDIKFSPMEGKFYVAEHKFPRDNISGKLNVLMHLHGNAGLLPQCSIGNHSRDGSKLRTHGILLLVCHSTYGPTMNGRLLAHCTKLYTVG